MTPVKKILCLLLPLFLLIGGSAVWGQKADTGSSDRLFQAARRAAFDSSNYPRAKSYLLRALRISPDYADIRIFLGRIYTWTNNYDSARIAFRQVLARQPDYEDAVVAYADLEYYNDNYERALDICRTALKNNLTSEPLMLREAKILYAMKRFDEAERSVKKLLLFNSNNADARVLANSISESKNKSQPQPLPPNRLGIDTTTADGLFQAARKAAFDSSNYPLAKLYLFKALRNSPGYADIRTFLGRVYTWTKNYDSARIAFRQVLASQPDYEDAVIAYADMEYFSDNYERALELVKTGLRNNPASEPLMLREAKILNALNRYDEADRAIQKLVFLNSNNKEAQEMANRFREAKNKPTVTAGTSAATGLQKKEGDTTSSDGLLATARKAAFDNKNYTQAKNYLYRALHISPRYADIKVFLGRIHTWTNNYDSARFYFTDVLKANPGYEEAAIAYSDMEYWNDNNQVALGITDSALVYHPSSEELLVRKAKILSSMRRYAEADVVVQKALRINKNNSDARLLADRIKELSTKNKIGLSYSYVYFDKQFSDPWHLASFDYTRRTGIGSVTGRVNYANRFTKNGIQYELEGYPRFSKTFYSYISAGYSDIVGVFPKWRGGFSLYINLPKSYEAELGFRYLNFSGDPTWIYTGYLGKYYKSWLFGARTYITPGNFSTVSTSYTISARYYYGSADDVLGINAGYGISPDDRLNSIQIDSKVRLVSYKAGISFKKKVSKFSVISVDGSWVNQEYLPQTKGNQYQFGLGWLYRF